MDFHIRSAFDKDLEAVQANVMKMGGLVENALLRAAEALERQCEEVRRLVSGVIRARRDGEVSGDRGRAPRRPASDEGSREGDPWDSRS